MMWGSNFPATNDPLRLWSYSKKRKPRASGSIVLIENRINCHTLRNSLISIT